MKRIGLLVLALLTVCGLTLSGVPALPAAGPARSPLRARRWRSWPPRD